MIFFFKKKPIHLYCATNRPEVFEYAPVQRASKFFPDWWKKLPSSMVDPQGFFSTATMKSCPGFADLYGHGIMTPMWCDLALQIGKEKSEFYRYQFSDMESSIQSHHPAQYGEAFSPLQYQHLKIMSPWAFYCEEQISFMTIEPIWDTLKFPSLRVLPGIVDYKYQSATHINLLIRRSDADQEILIPYLTPIYHVIPLSDRPLKLHVSNDVDLFNKIELKRYRTKFMGKHKTNIKRGMT